MRDCKLKPAVFAGLCASYPLVRDLAYHLPASSWRSASMLRGLAKARLRPAAKVAAKAAGQAPAKQEVGKKHSCSSANFTQGGESATLRKGASILVSLRNASTKRRRSPEELRALSLLLKYRPLVGTRV